MKIRTLVVALLCTLSTASVVAAETGSSPQVKADTNMSDGVRVSRIRVNSAKPEVLNYEFIGGRLDNDCGSETGPWAESTSKNINDVLRMAYTLNLLVRLSVGEGCQITSVITVK